jgi:hypothetical protein
LPCLALAQYPSNGNQKITLGEQTSADGLIWRGVAADTTLTAKSDTAAYFVLDTVNINLYTYKASATGRKWRQLGADTAAIAYVNTYGTQTVNGAKTFTTAPTFSTALLGESGGTGLTTFGAANRIPFASSTTALTTSDDLTFTGTVLTLTKNSSGSSFATLPNIAVENTNTSANSYSAIVVKANNSAVMGDILADGFGNIIAGGAVLFRTVTNHPFAISTDNTPRMRVTAAGEVWIAGTTDRGAYNLQVNGTGVWGEGAYLNGSDANIKENIIDLDSSLNIVNNLKPVVFNYINASVNNDTKHLGFIAQDVYQTLENKNYLGSIVRSDGDTLSIAYSNFIPLLTKAIQEQNLLIKALEQRIINLENK